MARVRTGCRIALVLNLSLVLPWPAGACDANCAVANAKAVSKPLDLKRFMRPAIAQTGGARAKPRDGERRTTAPAQPERSTVTVLPPPRPPLPGEAETALASQAAAPMRIWQSDELNDIDLASSAPAETTGAAPATDLAVQTVDAGEFNDIDRNADVVPPSEPQRRSLDPPAREAGGEFWMQRSWRIIIGALANITAALQRLFG
jgi:hypothetical protein